MTISKSEREQGKVFAPKFDANGLLTAVVVNAANREVLMVAFMDAERDVGQCLAGRGDPGRL